MFALAALAFYAMDPRGDRQETVEFPKAQAVLANAVFLHEAARGYLESYNMPIRFDNPNPTGTPRQCTLQPLPYGYIPNEATFATCMAGGYGSNIDVALWAQPAPTREMRQIPVQHLVDRRILPTGFNAGAAQTFLFCINLSSGVLDICWPPSSNCDRLPNMPRIPSRDCCGFINPGTGPTPNPNILGANQETMSFVFTYVPIPFRYEERGSREFLRSAVRRYASGMTIGFVEAPLANPIGPGSLHPELPNFITEPDTTRHIICGADRYVRHPFTGDPVFIPPAIINAITDIHGQDPFRDLNNQPSAIVIFQPVPGGRCFPTRRAIPADRDDEACEHRLGPCPTSPWPDVCRTRYHVDI